MSNDNSLVDALAFLYVTFGQATDGTLTADEMRTLAEKLGKRAPELSLEQLGQVLRSTVTAYKGVGSREEKIERAQQHAAVLRDSVDEGMRQAIINDLSAIAAADGEVSDQEQAFIARTAQTLGVALPS
ncbi:MAG: TerB family tellurite resistance protein [Myxococcales bacterium]|nr:TerB family tellurite resistance protein [Myxococcales bacterium]MCB9717038.1 TerB family tellurite resistance protein [Myxococcales bacterium]